MTFLFVFCDAKDRGISAEYGARFIENTGFRVVCTGLFCIIRLPDLRSCDTELFKLDIIQSALPDFNHFS